MNPEHVFFRIGHALLCIFGLVSYAIISIPVGASVEVGDCIIVLADRFLQQMPLEALPVFKDDGGNSVSRDFSLQLLYNRIHTEQTGNV